MFIRKYLNISFLLKCKLDFAAGVFPPRSFSASTESRFFSLSWCNLSFFVLSFSQLVYLPSFPIYIRYAATSALDLIPPYRILQAGHVVLIHASDFGWAFEIGNEQSDDFLSRKCDFRTVSRCDSVHFLPAFLACL